jgi:PAS domain S-box-containing protein
MLKNKRPLSVESLKLSNPQRAAVAKLLARQKGKYKKLLHEAHERMHIIGDLSSSLEFWYNVNGSYEFVSPACQAVLGYPREAFLHEGLRLETIVHPDEKERFRSDKSRALSGESGADVEYTFLSSDGSERHMLMTWNPVLTRRGRHIGVRISLRDITEFRTCQHFSKAYRELMLAISDELQQTAIFSLTPDGAVLSWNRSAEQLFGYGKKEIQGRDFITLFSEDAELDSRLPAFETIATKRRIEREMPFQKKNGEIFSSSITFHALCDQNQALHLVTCIIPVPSPDS